MLIYDPMKIFFEQSPIIDNKYFPKLSTTLLIQDASTIIYKKSYNKVPFSKLNFNKVDDSAESVPCVAL